MGILDQKLIQGIKPKQRPDPKLIPGFDKTQPIGPYNAPTMSYATYRIYGNKVDAAGIKHPVSWEETLPMGKRIRFKKEDYPGIEVTRCERAIGGPRLF